MKSKQELIISGLQQRIVEIVSDYESKLITFRVEATIDNDKLKAEIQDLKIQIQSLEDELQLFRNREMEVNNEKC